MISTYRKATYLWQLGLQATRPAGWCPYEGAACHPQIRSQMSPSLSLATTCFKANQPVSTNDDVDAHEVRLKLKSIHHILASFY